MYENPLEVTKRSMSESGPLFIGCDRCSRRVPTKAKDPRKLEAAESPSPLERASLPGWRPAMAKRQTTEASMVTAAAAQVISCRESCDWNEKVKCGAGMILLLELSTSKKLVFFASVNIGSGGGGSGGGGGGAVGFGYFGCVFLLLLFAVNTPTYCCCC